MKTNFRKNEEKTNEEKTNEEKIEITTQKDLSPEEFEKFIVSSGAKGSFMVYRSPKKDDELGMDNL